jgi:predicted Zn-dependent peptidase
MLRFSITPMKENIEVTRLSNGLTILTEKMPDVRSATLGFFYRLGSRNEPDKLNGICHFIEHCVFKGTAKRNALEIAIETDRLGGHFDAFTSHEETAFTIKVVDKQIPNAFDLIADMLANPLFDENELQHEQNVIIEEMKMVEDTPEELLSEIFSQNFFPNHPLGLSIAGTPKTVKTFNRKVTQRFHEEYFCPNNLIITAAGNIEHARIVELAESFFCRESRVKSRESRVKDQKPKTKNPILLKQKRNLEQTHLLIATPFLEAKSEKRYAANLLASVLGGGTSSRLWQKIREENGLAYSVGASAISYADCGLFQIFAAMSPGNFLQTVDLSMAELKRIKHETIPETELQIAKDQLSASLLLGLEDSSFRAGNLASCEITHGRQISIEETLQNIEKVTVEDLQELADEFFKTENFALVGLGNFKDVKIERDRLSV